MQNVMPIQMAMECYLFDILKLKVSSFNVKLIQLIVAVKLKLKFEC